MRCAQWRPQLTLHYAIISFSKLALIVPLMVRFVHVVRCHAALASCTLWLLALTVSSSVCLRACLPAALQTGSVTKLSHGTKDTSRIRSIRVYWTNRTAAAQQWLLPDIAKLERRDAEGLFSFHVRGSGVGALCSILSPAHRNLRATGLRHA